MSPSTTSMTCASVNRASVGVGATVVAAAGSGGAGWGDGAGVAVGSTTIAGGLLSCAAVGAGVTGAGVRPVLGVAAPTHPANPTNRAQSAAASHRLTPCSRCVMCRLSDTIAWQASSHIRPRQAKTTGRLPPTPLTASRFCRPASRQLSYPSALIGLLAMWGSTCSNHLPIRFTCLRVWLAGRYCTAR